MPPKKKSKISPEAIRYFFIIIFLFFWFATFLADWSKFWTYLNFWLEKIFWEYYKIVFAPVLIMFSAFMIKDKKINFNFFIFFWFILYFSSLINLISFFKNDYNSVLNFYEISSEMLWSTMSFLIFFIIFLISLVIIFNFSPINFLNHLLRVPWKIWEIKETFVWEWLKVPKKSEKPLKEKSKADLENEKLKAELERIKQEKLELEKQKNLKKQQKVDFENLQKDKAITVEIKEKSWLFWKKQNSENNENNDSKDKNNKVKLEKNPSFSKWNFPSLNLLNDKSKDIVSVDKNEIRKKELEIQEKLLQFKIEVEMQWYQVGPTVIQYRLKPKDWIKLQKIVNLKDDLALALHAKSLRIQAPIPWLWAVWIEVPNPKREPVYLKEVLNNSEFNNPKIEIPLSIWKDVSWNILIWDLADMPHLLVAWQTKSWKSVWMNGFIMSMLYKFSPSDLRMIMIDPKMVELSVYNWIPHLLTPVITNADKALNSLKWSVAEMLRRYQLASKVNAKNLIEYNQKVDKNDKFHYIIIIIDELADLMMSWNKKEIEDSIARIAQMWRAVWMHLIIATQRPSVNVLTWLIKANVPSRIAFTVASWIDSRTVLDQGWAEDLLWRWDMLYYPTWAPEPERVQWVFVETSEVEKVVNELKLTIDPDILKNLQIPEISEWKSKFEGSIMEKYEWNQDEDPKIIEDAIEILRKEKKGSTSLLQRKLWLWYARAAKVLDILEDLEIVWPSNWSKPREVYID